jgi:hypothetical protein
MTQRYAHIALICLAVLAFAPSRLEAQDRGPYTLDQVIQLVESGVFSDSRILMLTRESCLGFRVDDDATRRLVTAGASEGLIASLRRLCVQLPQVVTYVVVTPAQLDVPVGANGILRARALSPDSVEIANVMIQWSSEDTSVADVSGGGVVIGKSAGETRITAGTEAGPSGTTMVRVAAVTEAETPGGQPETGDEVTGGKNVGTAAALGVVIPGGGELYTGNTGKGAAILIGSGAAIAAGLLITSEEVIGVSLQPTTPNCNPVAGTCLYQDADTRVTVEETGYFAVGAAVAGALWVYGLIDGVRAAKKSQAEARADQGGANPGLSLRIAPPEGIKISPSGYTEITLIQIRL